MERPQDAGGYSHPDFMDSTSSLARRQPRQVKRLVVPLKIGREFGISGCSSVKSTAERVPGILGNIRKLYFSFSTIKIIATPKA